MRKKSKIIKNEANVGNEYLLLYLFFQFFSRYFVVYVNLLKARMNSGLRKLYTIILYTSSI